MVSAARIPTRQFSNCVWVGLNLHRSPQARKRFGQGNHYPEVGRALPCLMPVPAVSDHQLPYSSPQKHPLSPLRLSRGIEPIVPCPAHRRRPRYTPLRQSRPNLRSRLSLLRREEPQEDGARNGREMSKTIKTTNGGGKLAG